MLKNNVQVSIFTSQDQQVKELGNRGLWIWSTETK